MRYIAVTALGAAALMLVCAPVVSQAQTTTDQQQTTTEKPTTTEQKPGMMQKMEEKTKSATSAVEQKSKSAAGAATDSWVTSKVKIALIGDERVKGRQVSVSSKGGMVTLRGKVDSEEAKMAAADVAKGVEHVKGVTNELQVVPMAERKQVVADDKVIAENVEKRLKADPQLKGARITARSDAGIVTLTGHVKTIALSSRASEVASDVEGVKAVRNDLTMQQSTSRADK